VSAIKFAKFFLPPKQRAHLETLVNKQLEKEKKSGRGGFLTKEKEWMDVVDIISRYPLIYPSYHENYQEIEDVVIASMHKECAFEAAYGEEKVIKLLYPVRLIRREQVLYVTCSESRYKDNQKFKDYAIHRLSNVSEKPSERNIEVTDEEIKKNSERKKDKVLSLLKLRIQGIAVEHFKTVRFHESLSEQKKTQYEDWYINGKNRKEKADGIVLTVNDIEYTYEMETWLLGFGGNVEVLEPKNIRDEMKAHAKKMADIYINEKSD
jgi:hypothetical protein